MSYNEHLYAKSLYNRLFSAAAAGATYSINLQLNKIVHLIHIWLVS